MFFFYFYVMFYNIMRIDFYFLVSHGCKMMHPFVLIDLKDILN